MEGKEQFKEITFKAVGILFSVELAEISEKISKKGNQRKKTLSRNIPIPTNKT